MDEGVDISDYVRVVEFFHDVHFSKAFLSLLLVSHIKDLSIKQTILLFF